VMLARDGSTLRVAVSVRRNTEPPLPYGPTRCGGQ
jgi:hypothetical protein